MKGRHRLTVLIDLVRPIVTGRPEECYQLFLEDSHTPDLTDVERQNVPESYGTRKVAISKYISFMPDTAPKCCIITSFSYCCSMSSQSNFSRFDKRHILWKLDWRQSLDYFIKSIEIIVLEPFSHGEDVVLLLLS